MKPHTLLLQKSRATLLGTDGELAQSFDGPPADTIPLALGLIRQSLPAWRSADVLVRLSTGLASPFSVGPFVGLRRWSEAVTLAQAAAPPLFGALPQPCVTLLQWPVGAPALALSVPKDVQEELSRSAKQHRIRLLSLSPWWATSRCWLDCVNGALGSQQMLAFSDQDGTVIVCWAQGRPRYVERYQPALDSEALRSTLDRIGIAEGYGAEEVGVLHIDNFLQEGIEAKSSAPQIRHLLRAHGAPSLELLRWQMPTGRLPRLGLLVCLLLTLGSAATVLTRYWEYAERATMLAAERQARELSIQAQPAASPLVEPPPPYAESAQELLKLYQFNWQASLRSLEAVELQGVTPTSLEINAIERQARLSLAVTDPNALPDYLSQLNVGGDYPEIGQWQWRLTQIQRSTGQVMGVNLVGSPTLLSK